MQPHHLPIDWAQVYFSADAYQEAFTDVRLVTIKSEYLNAVQEQAIDIVGCCDETLMREAAKQIVLNKQISIKEYVTVNNKGDIKVAIMSDQVDSVDAWMRSLDLVSQALSQLNGQSGTIEFGESIYFNVSDLWWIQCH